jgi:hypothetical protein
MNHLNLKNKLDAQISSYIDYQKTTTRAKSIKISKEIARLSQIIESIDMMPYPVQKRQIDSTIEHKHSKLNFQPTETKDMSNKKRNPPELCKPIFDEPKDSRNRALELVASHKHIKPIKYLLKN